MNERHANSGTVVLQWIARTRDVTARQQQCRGVGTELTLRLHQRKQVHLISRPRDIDVVVLRLPASAAAALARGGRRAAEHLRYQMVHLLRGSAGEGRVDQLRLVQDHRVRNVRVARQQQVGEHLDLRAAWGEVGG